MMSADFLQELAYRHLTRTMNTLAGGLILLGAPHPRNCTAFFLVQLGLPLEYLLFIVLFDASDKSASSIRRKRYPGLRLKPSARRHLRSFAKPIQSRSYQQYDSHYLIQSTQWQTCFAHLPA
jgi:hypothetical protein